MRSTVAAVAHLPGIGALTVAETDAVQGVRVLEQPEDAEGALGLRQTARLVLARGQLRRQRGGAAVGQRVPQDGEPHDGCVGGGELRREAELVRPLGAAATVLGLDAVALAPDVVPEGGVQDELGVGRLPAELLEKPLRVHVHAAGVAGAVEPGMMAEPGVVHVGRTSGPRDGVRVVRAGHGTSIARGPDG